jgi:carboxylesterase|tara:strand:+ start:184 stop:1053 length:870 start_codon:yes stop_codon:yes gene_type:complete
MKKIFIYIITAVILLFIVGLNVKLSLEKPKTIHKESIDLSDGTISDLNNNFLIEKDNEIGVLMVHGLGASPYQTIDLANFLADKGVTVSSIRLQGHGTNLKDLEDKKWEDWYNDVEIGYNELKQKTEKTYVLGISLGTSLILNLAEHHELNGMIAIAPPIYLRDKKTIFVPMIRLFKKYHYFGVDQTQIGHAYENLPTGTISEFMQLIKISKKQLSNIKDPILIIQSEKDTLVLPESAKYVYDTISSEQKELLFVRSVSHAVIRIYEDDTKESAEERKNIFDRIYKFLK